MSKKGKKTSEIFISHSNQDRAFVTRLVALLRKNKIPFWYSPKHIIGAAQWHDEIGKGLARCDWFDLSERLWISTPFLDLGSDRKN